VFEGYIKEKLPIEVVYLLKDILSNPNFKEGRGYNPHDLAHISILSWNSKQICMTLSLWGPLYRCCNTRRINQIGLKNENG
jgi:hypothetical protein